jgi:hypothetical protein
MLSPAKASAVMNVLIETSPLPADIKKKFRDAGEDEGKQPDPKMQEAMAKLALQKEESKGKMEVAQLEAAAEMQIERDKASNQMAIDRDKAKNQFQLEMFKAQEMAKQKRDETIMTAQVQREANPPPIDQFAPMLQRQEQMMQALAQALSKKRRAVFHRDPHTNRMIGAEIEG